MVEVGQLAEREWPVGEFGGRKPAGTGRWGPEAIARRMWRLGQAGLVASRRWWYDRPAVWTVTAAGLREAGLPLEPSVVDVRSYDHDLACVWLCLELEREFAAVLTERELATAERGAARPQFSPQAIDAGRISRRRHLPDLAILDGDDRGRPLAIELERTVKHRPRLEDIVRMYCEAPHLAGVRYYVTNNEAEVAVRRAVDSVLVEDLSHAVAVEVRAWRPPS